jgi:hypothetical protein
LSNASPAASSRVWPTRRYRPGPSIETIMVWPPDTRSTVTGHSIAGWSSKAAKRWPSRWLTPTKGTSHARASALASLTPTSNEPMRPGPTVAATAVSSGPRSPPARANASATTGVSSSTWARPASSGTTPPNAACRSTWLATTDDSTLPPASTAAAVSSHDVSMPSTNDSTPLTCVTVTAPRFDPDVARSCRCRCRAPT